jgi:fructose-1,6-bisphosphatase/inositol monophosphatase family enzyme
MNTVNQDHEIDLNFLRACLQEAGTLAVSQRGQRVADVKADHSPVTVVDKQVENFLIERISSRYPTHQILSEESGLHTAQSTTYSWIIDPIDGTRSFASGLPIWGVSIGVLREGQPIMGGFFLPVTQEMYWGDCQQAFYNFLPLPPLKSMDLNSPLVFLAVSSDFHLHFHIDYPRIRSLGSMAAHLAYVTTGAAVGMLAREIKLWDIAGLLPSLQAVGGKIVYLDGSPFNPADALTDGAIRQPLVAAHPSVLNNLLAKIH